MFTKSDAKSNTDSDHLSGFWKLSLADPKEASPHWLVHGFPINPFISSRRSYNVQVILSNKHPLFISTMRDNTTKTLSGLPSNMYGTGFLKEKRYGQRVFVLAKSNNLSLTVNNYLLFIALSDFVFSWHFTSFQHVFLVLCLNVIRPSKQNGLWQFGPEAGWSSTAVINSHLFVSGPNSDVRCFFIKMFPPYRLMVNKCMRKKFSTSGNFDSNF